MKSLAKAIETIDAVSEAGSLGIRELSTLDNPSHPCHPGSDTLLTPLMYFLAIINKIAVVINHSNLRSHAKPSSPVSSLDQTEHINDNRYK